MAGRYKPYPEYKDSGIEWLGVIPNTWSIARMDDLAATIKDQIAPKELESKVVIHYSIPTVQEIGIGRAEEGDTIDSNKFIVTGGDVLFSKLNPRKQTISIVASHEHMAVASTEFVVLRLTTRDQRYLQYLLYSQELSSFVCSQVESATKSHQRINPSVISKLKFALPPENERSRISNFLDHEIAKIDTLIKKQQLLIQLLKEKRQAAISHAVTKGLNPNVKLRNSGVEWLGKVPEGWVVVNIRNLIRAEVLEIQDGNHGELHPVAAEYVDDGIPFLMANNVQNGTVSLRESKYITLERADKLRIGFSQPNDLLLTHKGTVGEVALVPELINAPYWMLTPQVTYYRWKSKRYLSRFFYMFFRSSCFQVQLDIIGEKQSTRAYVGLIAQGDLILAVPPIDEQSEICSYLESAVSDYDYLISKAESAITLSQERRTSLISAAVTGKIDVRDWVAPKANQTNKEVAA